MGVGVHAEGYAPSRLVQETEKSVREQPWEEGTGDENNGAVRGNRR